jgi:hypothetical protein
LTVHFSVLGMSCDTRDLCRCFVVSARTSVHTSVLL